MKRLLNHTLLLFVLLTSGCSVAVDQAPNPTPIETDPGNEGNLEKDIPVTWTDLNLTGRLVFIHYDPSDLAIAPRIDSLDLLTGKITTLFRTTSGGWIYYLSASPDGSKLVISYVPPSDGTSKVSQALYVVPLDGSQQPQILFPSPSPGDQYIQVEWSPDGKYIYYVHVNQLLPLEPGQLSPVYTLYRISYPEGIQEKVAENAFWPRLSPDSSRIVFISNDPFAAKNLLYIANANGDEAREVGFSGSWIPEIKDAPLILPDGQTMLFSAPIPPVAYQPNWLDRLMGVQVAQAHSVPSDWWSISTNGGLPERLTQIQAVNLFASLSPDKSHIASLSGDGLFVMNLDGSDLQQIFSDKGVFGTVSWIP